MAEQTDSKVPQIRFKGFEGEWVEKTLGEAATFRRGSFPQPYGLKQWYDGAGAMPFAQVFDVTKNLSLVPQTKQQISILAQPKSVFVAKGSVVVTLQGSIGRVALLQYDAFVDRTLLIFKSYASETDTHFWAFLIQELFDREKQQAPGGTIKTITKEALSTFQIVTPHFEEQTKIGGYFKELDGMIALHQRKHGKLVTLKQAMLQKMFPQNGATTPQIRFKGFSEPWVGKVFKDITTRATQPSSENALPRLEYEDIISNSGRLNKDLTKKKTHKKGMKFEKGDVLFGKLRPYLRNWFLADFEGVAVGDFWVLKPSGAVSSFIYQIIQTRAFETIANQSAGSKMPRSDWNLVSNSVFLLPPDTTEQQKIGSYFRRLDTLITKHATQLEKLKQIKSACLEKMFV